MDDEIYAPRKRSRHDASGCASERGSSSSSLARACLLLCACALTWISLALSPMVCSARAATWPVPTSELSASVSFHESYTAGVKSYVHSGIDIPASAGMQISSPLAGTVRFTGTVPSGDSRVGDASGQQTMQAVSIGLDDGRTVTLMPFANIDVAEGQAVGEGQPLGTLAATGDASSAYPHLHMGCKVGSTYMDPMQLFGASSGMDSRAQGSEAAAVVKDAVVPSSGLAPSLATAASEAAPSLESSQSVDALPAQAPVAEQETFGTIETGVYDPIMQNASESPDAGFLAGAFAALLEACSGQLQALAAALAGVAAVAGVSPETAAAVVLAAAIASATGAAALHIKRHIRRSFDGVRSGSFSLFSKIGGDSIHKLFPAPGAAFMSRGRVAQRR